MNGSSAAARLRGVLGVVAACLPLVAPAVEAEDVRLPWQASRVQRFSDEAASGELAAKLFKPAAAPAPFIVFVHGCNGLRLPAVEHWAEFFLQRGVGVLMIDSLGPRGRQEACTETDPQWVRRRADDVGSAQAWLATQPFVVPERIALMGQSQGGSAVLLAAHRQAPGSEAIVGAIAMYPACGWGLRNKLQFSKPLLVFIGDEDTWTPAAACEQLKSQQADAAALELTIYPGARHAFDNPGVYRLALGRYPVGEHARSRDLARERIARFVDERLR